MSQLSMQSDRNELDHDAIDQDYARRADEYRNLAFGLSFHGQQIHFAEILRNADGFSVRKMGTIQTTMKFGTGIEGVERNVQGLFAYLKGCLEDNGIRAKRMNISLNTNLVTLHKVMVESERSESDFQDYIKWEFRQQVTDDFDQYILNTVPLEKTSPAPMDPMLMVGIRRRYADSLRSVLDKSKIQFSNMDVDILCTHATYEVNYDISYHGMTVLAECKPGSVTFLLCKDYDLQHVYQFTVAPKSTPQKIGELINAHIPNMMQAYHATAGNTNSVVGRVILCHDLAQDVLPYVQTDFNPSVIEPFRKIRLPAEFRPHEKNKDAESEASENDEKDNKSQVVIAPPDYSVYAEAVGAAIKLLMD